MMMELKEKDGISHIKVTSIPGNQKTLGSV